MEGRPIPATSPGTSHSHQQPDDNQELAEIGGMYGDGEFDEVEQSDENGETDGGDHGLEEGELADEDGNSSPNGNAHSGEPVTVAADTTAGITVGNAPAAHAVTGNTEATIETAHMGRVKNEPASNAGSPSSSNPQQPSPSNSQKTNSSSTPKGKGPATASKKPNGEQLPSPPFTPLTRSTTSLFPSDHSHNKKAAAAAPAPSAPQASTAKPPLPQNTDQKYNAPQPSADEPEATDAETQSVQTQMDAPPSPSPVQQSAPVSYSPTDHEIQDTIERQGNSPQNTAGPSRENYRRVLSRIAKEEVENDNIEGSAQSMDLDQDEPMLPQDQAVSGAYDAADIEAANTLLRMRDDWNAVFQPFQSNNHYTFPGQTHYYQQQPLPAHPQEDLDYYPYVYPQDEPSNSLRQSPAESPRDSRSRSPRSRQRQPRLRPARPAPRRARVPHRPIFNSTGTAEGLQPAVFHPEHDQYRPYFHPYAAPISGHHIGEPMNTGRVSRGRRRTRNSGTSRNDTDYRSLPDYSPPLSTLDERDISDFDLDWRGSTADLANDPDRGILHAMEIKLASKLRLSCAAYLCCKRRIFISRVNTCKIGKEYRKTDAQQACKIDVNKASQLWVAFQKVGWFHSEHFQKFL